MRQLAKDFVHFFTSLKLTVALLFISAWLVFFATLDQQNLGIWGIQKKWFHSLVVLHDFKGIPVPIFPGGYFVGGLLFLNLIAAHIKRFEFTWKKAGIFLTHLGLILLLVGELITGVMQEDYQMRIDEGETKRFAEHMHDMEVAIVDVTNANYDQVVAIPQQVLVRQESIQHPELPFRVVVKEFYPNAALQMRAQVPNAPPSPATAGIGPQIVAMPLAITYKPDERNLPAAFIELIGSQGSLGTYLVSAQLLETQTVQHDGRTFRLSLRPQRLYTPYEITLLDFTHEKYAGTEIPKNFSSQIRLKTDDGKTDREILIYMNNPLRFDGLTFYQAGYENDKTTILQVVRNPGWVLPYVACLLLTIGLAYHFCLSLVGFASKRSRKTTAAAAAA
jgi:hypothetical protein